MLILQMDTIARRVYLDAGGDTSPQREDVETILNALRNYCQPDSLDRVYLQVTEFSRYKRTDQTMERHPLEFDALRREAETRVISG